jgi:multisubunit Na+/H+ antiporter MnhB subunit
MVEFRELIRKVTAAIAIIILGFVILSSVELVYLQDLRETGKYFVYNYSATGTINVVAATLLDFRAYDTLGEILVLFIAISGVIALSKKIKSKDNDFKNS